MYEAEFKSYFAEHEEEMLEDLAALVAIDSQRMPAAPQMPFGEGPAAALAKGEELLKKHGMAVTNYENYVITGDLNGQPRKLDILAHLDVVPAGEGWSVTQPFAMRRLDGRVYGRGTSDDKGPAICVLYAMKAIKELGIPLKYGVRLILGSDEECGSGDIAYYYKKEKPAPMSFSPDADFPLINLEKGGLGSGFTARTELAGELPRVLKIQGGVKGNVVPQKAQALVEGLSGEEIRSYADAVTERTGVAFSMAPGSGGTVQILAEGQNAHAAAPFLGKNAVTALLELVAALPLADTKTHRKLKAVSRMFPCLDYYGKALSVDLEDEISGKTTLALTIFSFSGEDIEGHFDCRASIAANEENTQKVIYRKLEDAGLVPMDRQMYPPHYVKEDSELVQKLLAVYSAVTGKEAKPIAIGGGTYVHNIENGVAFGCGDPDMEYNVHGADEFMEIRQMLTSCEIFAQAILALCGED